MSKIPAGTTFKADLLFGRKLVGSKSHRHESFSGNIMSSTDHKFPHTAVSEAKRSAKRLLKGNDHMLDKKVKLRVRQMTVKGTKGPVVRSKSVTWRELTESSPSKLLK